MVLVQRTGATPLPNMEPDETEFGDSADDFNAVALALARMNEREHSYVMRQMNGRSSPTKGELTPRSIGTPRTPRSQFLSTPRTPRSNTLLGLDSTLLNDNVAFTQRNSAISHGYASPRQLTLSATHMSREGSGIPSRLRSLNGHRKISFDYDDTEGTFYYVTLVAGKILFLLHTNSKWTDQSCASCASAQSDLCYCRSLSRKH